MDRSAFPLELKAVGRPEEGRIEGIASVYGHRDLVGDVILPGTFGPGLAARKAAGRGLPPMLMEHGARDSRPVGVWESIVEANDGLHVKGRLVGLDTAHGAFNAALVRDGAVKGLSVGFMIDANGASRDVTGRVIKSATLHEISLTSDPANVRARIEIKSLAECVDALRSLGLSKSAANKVAHGGWSALSGEEPITESQEEAEAVERLSCLVRESIVNLKSI